MSFIRKYKRRNNLNSKKPIIIVEVDKSKTKLVSLILSVFALLISVITYTQIKRANDISENLKDIAYKSNDIAERSISITQEISKVANALTIKGHTIDEKFAIINAELVWNNLIDQCNDIDDEIIAWEEENKLQRDGLVVEDSRNLLSELIKVEVPPEIVRLYKKRFNKYLSLKNAAQMFEPFKDRLVDINLILPSKPRLPSGVLKGGGKGTLIRRWKRIT